LPATSGYAGVLVRHLRIRPGAGIIGAVYRSARPLLVANVRALPMRPRRGFAYRTPSFVSLPLVGADDVLGVMSVADRRDARAFERRDLNELRAWPRLRRSRSSGTRGSSRCARPPAWPRSIPVTGLFIAGSSTCGWTKRSRRARRQQAPLTALMLDVDNFKQLNDRLGHQAGDAVLRVIGDVLRRSVRLFDVCAPVRRGRVRRAHAGQRLRQQRAHRRTHSRSIEGSRPAGGPWSDEVARPRSASASRASWRRTGEELLARADQALYLAKREGRNRVAVSASADGAS